MKTIDNLQFVGSFSTTNTLVSEKINKELALSFNPKQSEMYRTLFIGLNNYDKITLYKMNSNAKKKIKQRQIRTQYEINLFKQQVLITRTNTLSSLADDMLEDEVSPLIDATGRIWAKVKVETENIPKLFTTGLFKKLLSSEIEPDPYFICRLSFKELGITKADIVNLLIAKNLLPKNFLEIE